MLSGLCKSIFITWHIIADQSGTGLWKHIPFCLTKLLKTKVGTQQRKNICNALNILLLGRLYSKQSRRLFILAPEPTSVHKYLKKHHWTSSLGSSQAKKKKIWASEDLFAHHQVQALQKYRKSSVVCSSTTFNKKKRDSKYLLFCYGHIQRYSLGMQTSENPSSNAFSIENWFP